MKTVSEIDKEIRKLQEMRKDALKKETGIVKGEMYVLTDSIGRTPHRTAFEDGEHWTYFITSCNVEAKWFEEEQNFLYRDKDSDDFTVNDWYNYAMPITDEFEDIFNSYIATQREVKVYAAKLREEVGKLGK